MKRRLTKAVYLQGQGDSACYDSRCELEFYHDSQSDRRKERRSERQDPCPELAARPILPYTNSVGGLRYVNKIIRHDGTLERAVRYSLFAHRAIEIRPMPGSPGNGQYDLVSGSPTAEVLMPPHVCIMSHGNNLRPALQRMVERDGTFTKEAAQLIRKQSASGSGIGINQSSTSTLKAAIVMN